MSEYVDRHGREWQGNAPADAIEEHCDTEDREQLGAEIRALREAAGLSVRQLARRIKRSHATVSQLERDARYARVVGRETLGVIADVLGVDAATYDRWVALSGWIAPDLLALLLAHPERWDDVRKMLGGDHA